jgi:hypothetical protein
MRVGRPAQESHDSGPFSISSAPPPALLASLSANPAQDLSHIMGQIPQLYS